MGFDSPDVALSELVAKTHSGKLRLPDFQREWKWDTDRIKSLLASVAQEFPVGVMMMLEVDGNGASFAPIAIAGAPDNPNVVPDWLVLDGQQRMTSLYQALFMKGPVSTKDPKGKLLKRWYYIDVQASIAPGADLEECIVEVGEDRMRRNFQNVVEVDLATSQKEFEARAFPLSIVFDAPALFAWQNGFVMSNPDDIVALQQMWNNFYKTVLEPITRYTVPVIVLKKDTPREAVCTVFEKVNTGGVALNVFELLTATFAMTGFKLKADWEGRKGRLGTHSTLTSVEDTDFLQAVCLLASRKRRHAELADGAAAGQAPAITCKRRDILRLQVEEYKEFAPTVEDALVWAASFLAQESVFRARDIPYRTQLVPLAAIRAVLGNEVDKIGVANRLRRWYWCGVLGELYGGTTETRFARDLGDVEMWITEDGPEPRTIQEASFNAGRLLTMKTRGSAAYKGVYALIMRGQCLDWYQNQAINMAAFFDYQLDIHHIFPKKWCNAHDVDGARRESVVNKTAIAARTNRIIGGRAPSVYLPMLEKRTGISSEQMDAILETHSVAPNLLRADDFDAFFDARASGLLELIEGAMGKAPVVDAAAQDTADDFEAEPDEIETVEQFAAEG